MNIIPKLLYKYREINSFSERMLSSGEIYFPTTAEFKDENEKVAFIMTNGAHIVDEQNRLIKLSAEEYTEYLRKAVKSPIGESRGILSLCDSREEVRMYNEYADKFRGICIGFEWEKFNLMFNGSYPPIKNIPRRVTYGEPIKIYNKFVTPDQWLEIFVNKLQKYSHEREYRMFYSSGIHASDEVKYAIKEIIFGHNVNDSEILRLKKMIGSRDNINFFRTHILDANKIEICPLL